MAVYLSKQPEVTLRVRATHEDTIDTFRFHDHQLRALLALTAYYETERRGVLVIPTGGGKTEAAARWCLRQRIAKGGRLLWLAHRRSLLIQAFETFCRAAREAGVGPDNYRETLRMIRISGDDANWSQVESEHDVVFATSNSTAAEASLGFVTRMASQSPGGLFVVVDEAHHISASGYQKILKLLEPSNFELLGLTATPVRMDERDGRRLWNSLGKVIYKVDKRELIENGILSIPLLRTVDTQIDFEKDLTSEDVAYMEQWGDLGERTLKKISEHAARNALIVDHYLEHSGEYDKTMVFAANIAHAVTLCSEFLSRGVRADYVASDKSDSNSVMEAFRTGRSLDVLVSVDMLTEGYDAPRTKTVFLTRPTQSESLFSQMMGRALRGPRAGGTREAHLVTFNDSWTRFQILDLEFVVRPGLLDELEQDSKLTKRRWNPIENEMILEAYRLVKASILSSRMSVYDCLPIGWYTWEEEFRDDLQTRRVLVFDHQFPFLEEIARGDQYLPDHHEFSALREDYDQLFSDCPEPRPRLSDYQKLREARKKGVQIHYYTFADKEEFSSARIARLIFDEDVVPRKQRERIQEVFDGSAICRAVYRDDFDRFHEEVRQELLEIDHVRSPGALPEELVPNPPPNLPDDHPGHDLYVLMRAQMGSFPEGLKINDIRFSHIPLRGYWGQFRLADRVILIHPLLNSWDFPLFVLEFLVYHELLHAAMPDEGHSKEFRARERAFTPSAEALQGARQLGYPVGKTGAYWRMEADRFLDSYHRRYLLPAGQGKMRK